MRASVLLALAAGVCLALAVAAAPPDLGAQDVEMRGRVHGKRPPPGYYEALARYPNAYQFKRVWKEYARRVRERRQALAAAGDYTTLNGHLSDVQPSVAAARAAGTAVTGTFQIPVLLGYFQDSTHVFQPDSTTIDSTLFSTNAVPPYSVTTYYDEVSNSLLTVTGDVVDWVKASNNASFYEGTNNGLDPSTDRTGDFIEELLNAADVAIDFSQYDGDGDGFVDLVAILQPHLSGACIGSVHIWPHRWVYSAWKGSAYPTNDGVSVDDYVIQSDVGGPSGCDSTSTMAIGTFTHELGHGMLDIPDLYDTGYNTDGIGHWGLMGAGNWNTQTSPAHLSAWSKDQVGWIAIDTVSVGSGTGTQVLNPIVTSDTALRVIPVNGNGEYFLVENRHRLGSDAMLAGEGLLIWHVDSTLIANRSAFNQVNAIEPHGLDLEQADGLDDLRNTPFNRGDAGDPWPGVTSNTVFGPSTTPNSELNDNTASGVQIDSITVNADKSIAFRVNLNVVQERITTSIGAGTEVIVDGVTQDAPYDVQWAFPTMHTIAVDSIQGDTLTRYVYQAWSDVGARSHSVAVNDATPDTFTAFLQTEYRLRAVPIFSGTINSSVPLDVNGIAWMLPAQTVQLDAIADPTFFFVQWEGDTLSIQPTLNLTMNMPYTVRARFGLQVDIASDTMAQGVMGASYPDTLTATGGSGNFVWTRTGGDAMPQGLTLDAPSGAITGVPEEDGEFQVVFQATSGALSDTNTVTIIITRPSLLLDNVVNHLLSPVAVLTADEERYLDIIGNNNGSFDVGDFRAFLQETGVLAADVLSAGILEALEQVERGNRGAARKEEGR
jgi:M6 family metalloprotease-like protein